MSTKPFSQIRNEVTNNDKYKIDTHTINEPSNSFKNSRTLNKTPINNNFKSKLVIGGGLLGGTGIAAGLLKSSHTNDSNNHFHNAFANISGVHENEGAVGTTVASSSGPMVATGGASFPMLKDKTNFSPEAFKRKLKTLKRRRS